MMFVQSYVVFVGVVFVGVVFQYYVLIVVFQVFCVYVQSVYGFWFQVGVVVFEVEGGDCMQSGFVVQVVVNGIVVGVIVCVWVDVVIGIFIGSIVVFGGVIYSYSYGQSQCSKFVEFQYFYYVIFNEFQCISL